MILWSLANLSRDPGRSLHESAIVIVCRSAFPPFFLGSNLYEIFIERISRSLDIIFSTTNSWTNILIIKLISNLEKLWQYTVCLSYFNISFIHASNISRWEIKSEM
nr:hypothetical protein 3 - Neurospora crassa mitochondrion plasmid maranhar [Neurospora crassa]